MTKAISFLEYVEITFTGTSVEGYHPNFASTPVPDEPPYDAFYDVDDVVLNGQSVPLTDYLEEITAAHFTENEGEESMEIEIMEDISLALDSDKVIKSALWGGFDLLPYLTLSQKLELVHNVEVL